MDFIRFGSKSSLDDDILILIDEIPSSKEVCKSLIKYYEGFFGVDANANLAVLYNGNIIDVYKGTPDEVNNSVFHTFKYHNQMYETNPVTSLVKRDVQLKLIRGFRIILSFLSRTSYRIIVKKALKSDIYDKIIAVSNIDLSLLTPDDFNYKKESYIDSIKTIAFQLGQMKGLLEGKEFYSKEDIIEEYPELICYLQRNFVPLDKLETFKADLIKNLYNVKFNQVYEY